MNRQQWKRLHAAYRVLVKSYDDDMSLDEQQRIDRRIDALPPCAKILYSPPAWPGHAKGWQETHKHYVVVHHKYSPKEQEERKRYLLKMIHTTIKRNLRHVR